MTSTAARSSELGLGPSSAEHIVVLCPGGVTRMVHAVPALRHLRDTYPRAVLTVACNPHASAPLAECPHVDHLVDLAHPIFVFDNDASTILLSFADPHDTGEQAAAAAWIARARGSRHTWVAAYRQAHAAAHLHVHPEWPACEAGRDRFLRLAWLLGGLHDRGALGIWPSLADRNGASRIVRKVAGPISVVAVDRYAADYLGSSGLARIIDAIAGLGMTPVLVGDRACVGSVELAIRTARSTAISACPARRTGIVVGLIERASGFVSLVDSPAWPAGGAAERFDALAVAVGIDRVQVEVRSSMEDAIAQITLASLRGMGRWRALRRGN